MITILLADDDPHIRSIVIEYAQAEDWQFIEAEDGLAALQQLEKNTFSLVVLDVMMPRLDGWTVLKQLRKNSQTPVILLTARDEEYDRLLGFELGVDDYVSKPFSPRELIARMKALLKRSGALALNQQTMRFGPLQFDPQAHRVWLDQKPLSLTPKEYDLLTFLAGRPDRAFTRDQLLNQVWGYDFYGDARTVDTHVRSLRDKLGRCRNVIGTVWGTGYRFEPGALADTGLADEKDSES
ncbi:MAG: response regulator transcription factor [Clostridiales bacterium]|nr:response regulator transcription factor [Clostridiales bacterium]